ncbi:hypothetical protein H7J73_10825, partial [Mycolicibacterium komossense]|nr:hypothetical protein [Mycolicibacterium komossense]
MLCAAPAGADVDQCAPPGVDSASALPTNLAAAASALPTNLAAAATTAPLDTVRAENLGLSTPGVLTVGTLSDAPPSICGTLSDAPPSICINSAGQFTGFDNELLRAI